MNSATELRLFVAIELPHDVLTALEKAQAALRAKGLEALRWVRPEGIHLTLKFLGETPASRLNDVVAVLKSATAPHAPHSLSLGKFGAFGSRQSPRVLWVDVSGDLDATRAMQSSIDDALAGVGFPKETRAFSPHLTLARVRPESAREVAGALASAITSTPAPSGTIPVQEANLMQSTLGPGGAVYKRLQAFPLEGAEVQS